jgi:putative FmdB family regulatory protein
MPLYEYRCEACDHQFERIQRFSDELVTVCPSCGSGPVVKLLSSPAIQFKGSGWYITDYARKESTSATKAAGAKEGSTSTDSTSSSSTDSTAKPAAPASTNTKSE